MSSPIIVKVFPEEMEIISVGGLSNGLSLKDILSGVSHCRNEVISNIFYHLKLVELYGTGLRQIQKNYQDFSKPPQFIANPKSFVIKLPNKNYHFNS